jgi:5,10-methylenetetrahydrofolate reductase
MWRGYRGANAIMTGLREALRAGRFVVTAEIEPPPGADRDAIGRSARLLRGWVDAANITDNPSAHVRISSMAGSVLAMNAGIEPVMQLTCRDRNRIGLQSSRRNGSRARAWISVWRPCGGSEKSPGWPACM